MQTGLDCFLETDPHRAGEIGWLVNAGAVTAHMQWGPAIALAKGFHVQKLFSPEHGPHGVAQAGVAVADQHDPISGLLVHSLYGTMRQPTADMLTDLHTIVMDMQDVGVRYATYFSTAAAMLEAAHAHEIPVIVLDRPNGLGRRVQGPLLAPGFESFVGIGPLPVRHGLTLGEFSRWYCAERRLSVALTVIRVKDWNPHEMTLWTRPFLPPSPNLNTPESVLLYSGTCLFEATNISEGRGTTLPFQVIGAPWLRTDQILREVNPRAFGGLGLRRTYFRPAFSKWADAVCEGIHLHVIDPDKVTPIEAALELLSAIFRIHPQARLVGESEGGLRRIDALWGHRDLGDYLAGKAVGSFSFDHATRFHRSVAHALLY